MAAAGHEVDVQLGLSPEQLVDAIAGANALVIRSATTVTAEVLAAGTDLVVVGRAGIGLDNVDVAAATERGVMVVNAPQSNILSAAEQAMALLLAQARNIPQAHAALVAGKWERSKWEGVELHGKTLGIVGLGRVGALVAQRALAFGMRLVAYDPFVSADRARHMGVELMDLDQLMAESDFVTVHLPKNKETLGLIGADMLAKAKPGLRIINTARGGIVDEEALADAIRNGPVQGAGLDVFAKEPTTESPLFELPSVVVAPHLGASTAEAQDKAGVTIAEQVILALAGDFVPFAVNVNATDVSETVRPFMGLAEQLGRILSCLEDGLPDSLEIEYQGGLAGAGTGHPHPVGAEGAVRRGHGRAGVLRERPAAGGRARARGARGVDGHGPRLRQPDHPPERRPRRGRNPDRSPFRATAGDGGRPHRRGARRHRTWSWCATTTVPA